MHLRSVTTDQSFSIDPRSCVYSVALTQTGTIEGGTGNFALGERDEHGNSERARRRTARPRRKLLADAGAAD